MKEICKFVEGLHGSNTLTEHTVSEYDISVTHKYKQWIQILKAPVIINFTNHYLTNQPIT